MSQSLVKGKNLDVSKITFSAPKVLDNGAKLVYVNYNGGRFNIQTPSMELPWNLSCYNEGPYPKYSCELSFRGMDENEDLSGFHDKLLELENKIIDAGVENGTSWFKLSKAKLNRDVIGTKFGNMVKVSLDKETGEPNGKYPPTIKLKVPCRDNVWESKLYNTEKEPYTINGSDPEHNIENIIVKGAKAKCIMTCVGLWIASGNYMCQWKLTKAEIDVPESAGGNDFLPDSDEEGEGDNANENTTEPAMLDDTASEDEPEPTAKSEAEPEPVASKKKVLKKKSAGS